jgi:hypothetical protein
VALVPVLFHDNHADSVLRRPPAAAPAPQSPGRPSKDPHPPAPSGPPELSQSPPPAGLPVRAVPVSVTPPARLPGRHTPKPKLPIPSPPPSRPPVAHGSSPLLAVSLPHAGAQVWLRPKLSVRTHLGSVRLSLGSAQP